MGANEQSIEIKLRTFGETFSSRTEGREAALSTIAYHFNKQHPKVVVLDFDGVLIMTPSWLGEYVQTLMSNGVTDVQFKNDKNITVASSIEFIADEIRSSDS